MTAPTVSATLAIAGTPVVRLDDVDASFAARVVRRTGATVLGDGSPTHPLDGVPCPVVVNRFLSATLDDLASRALVALVREGVAPVHAVAFRCRGRLALVAGRSGTGKTAALLGAADAGAIPWAAEWVHLLPDGGAVRGRQRVRVRGRHLREIHGVGMMVRRDRRLAAGLLHEAAELSRRMAPRSGPAASAIARVADAIDRRAWVDVRLSTIWPRQADSTPDRPAAVVVLERLPVDAGRGGVRDCRPLVTTEVVARIAAAFEDEARPGAPDAARYRASLARALDGIPAWEIRHDGSDTSALAPAILGLAAW